MTLARRASAALLRTAAVNRAVRALARLRGHHLVLVYHRLGTPLPPGAEIVPSVPPDVFRAQLQALGDVVDLVTLDEIVTRLSAPTRSRPAVALTLDDDLPSHTLHALPALRKFGLPAAFFLSGRVLHGRGGYWFQHLEELLVNHGDARTAAFLGLADVGVSGVMHACEANPDLRQRVCELAANLPAPAVLDRNGMSALAEAGMTIGFHTVDHHSLPGLTDAALQDAVSTGRADLAAAVGTAVRYFAYPHGKADERSAAAVRSVGFDAAFTGRAAPLRPRDDRYRLGRWEPGPLAVDDLIIKLAIRLNRAAPDRGYP
jgi:peptidoglycan/xylan/chitin deacetylase (PgdA/CDA1 family)